MASKLLLPCLSPTYSLTNNHANEELEQNIFLRKIVFFFQNLLEIFLSSKIIFLEYNIFKNKVSETKKFFEKKLLKILMRNFSKK